jgi:hypothetical protein
MERGRAFRLRRGCSEVVCKIDERSVGLVLDSVRVGHCVAGRLSMSKIGYAEGMPTRRNHAHRRRFDSRTATLEGYVDLNEMFKYNIVSADAGKWIVTSIEDDVASPV